MSILGPISAVITSVSVCFSVWIIWPRTLKPSPRAGERGRRRTEALKKNPLFARFEVLMCVLSGHLDGSALLGLRAKIEKKLGEAGRPLGLDGSDFVAVSIITGLIGACLGGALSAWLGKGGGPGVFCGGVIGSALPFFKLDETVNRRRFLVSRALPYAVDLAALSLEAGLDFTGAISQVILRLAPDNPIRFEFEHMLRKMSLGWSRRDALTQFAERVPTVQVRQFTGSVIQAEERGTPLAHVLSTQAEVMRTKRSQAAEQAAARAAILILGPLMLIFACVFIILLGPFAIKFIRGELF